MNWTGPIADIRYVGLSSDLQQQVESKLPVHKGDFYGHDTFGAAVAALNAVDSHLNLTVQIARDGGPVNLVIALPPARGVAAPPPPPPPPPPAPNAAAPAAPGAVRVGGNVQAMNLITKVTPVYPPLAKQAHVTGTVSLSVTISKEGTVDNVELVSGHPLLVQSAIDAVKQWVYRPTLLNGSPTAVLTQVDVNYTLAE